MQTLLNDGTETLAMREDIGPVGEFAAITFVSEASGASLKT
jgi:hypothetical protein